jgi:hypothetical protein
MRTLSAAVVFLAFATAAPAHDLERTRILLTFAEDGSFVLDIGNDPNWLLLRLESFAPSTRLRSLRTGGQNWGASADAERDTRLRELGPVLIDRVVLWVDGREIRPESAEYLPSETIFRLRGRMPLDARSLRWLYGSVIDSYPLIVRRPDGRTHAELIEGSNWSGTIDLSGQFKPTRFAGVDHIVLLVGFFAVMVWVRAERLRRRRRSPSLPIEHEDLLQNAGRPSR